MLDRDYALHEYAEAQIQDAFYNAYNWVSLRTSGKLQKLMSTL